MKVSLFLYQNVRQSTRFQAVYNSPQFRGKRFSGPKQGLMRAPILIVFSLMMRFLENMTTSFPQNIFLIFLYGSMQFCMGFLKMRSEFW
jgi:hypothetical protein